MRLNTAAVVMLSTAGACKILPVAAFSSNAPLVRPALQQRSAHSRTTDNSLAVAAAPVDETTMTDLDYEGVNRLTFRELQKACKASGLPAVGSTSVLRARLLEFFGIDTVDRADGEVATPEEQEVVPRGIQFSDEADPDFDFKALLDEVMQKSSVGHWKAATRKLKQLKKRHATPERPIPQEAYVAVLEACAADRLHGARASEPARKIIEEMADQGLEIPPALGNSCVRSSLGSGPSGTHDGFGGIDPALAMLSAIESSPAGNKMITVDTYGDVVSALSRDGAVEEAILLLRAMVVEHSFTPSLSTFADVAEAAAKDGSMSETILQIMTLAKAAGYELDSIASAEGGRSLLASGVIAAEQMDNLALGLRFLTAAGKAEGCAPARGDDLVASSSAAAQRACTLIHKRAIDKAIEENNWKLAVKLLELMPTRSLTPATSVWRKVVTVCAKCEKSRKATAVLFDWIKYAEEGKVDKPPINVFNTVVNACEVCGEEELTLVVLEAMKKMHDTEGNIVTFNIALKRLAKLGQTRACEGIIIGMLEAGIEPSVVSYTTAIGACAKAPQDSEFAYEWLKRMRSRNVKPNFHTYNTALAACLDGKLESTVRGSTIATEMLADVDKELEVGLKGPADYKSSIPDSYTKVLARQLMKQLRENWRSGDINMQVAKATLRVPLLKLVDFEKSEAAERVKKQVSEVLALKAECDELEGQEAAECQLEFDAVTMLHKDDHRTAEV